MPQNISRIDAHWPTYSGNNEANVRIRQGNLKDGDGTEVASWKKWLLVRFLRFLVQIYDYKKALKVKKALKFIFYVKFLTVFINLNFDNFYFQRFLLKITVLFQPISLSKPSKYHQTLSYPTSNPQIPSYLPWKSYTAETFNLSSLSSSKNEELSAFIRYIHIDWLTEGSGVHKSNNIMKLIMFIRLAAVDLLPSPFFLTDGLGRQKCVEVDWWIVGTKGDFEGMFFVNLNP